MGTIKVLDCTLRDGGFALEDAVKNNIKTEQFGYKEREYLARHIVNSGVEIIEIGAIEVTPEDKRGFAIYQDMQGISSVMPQKADEKQMFAGFYRGPDIDVNTVPEKKESMLDIARVCLRYSELEKSLIFSKGLSTKGYKVFLQPMVTVRYSIEELLRVIDAANDMNAYAVYFVDSYGYMNPKDIEFYYELFDKHLKENIAIGFHAHNNMEMALINVIKFLSLGTNRNVIIDSCVSGMGQGTGNLQTEVITNYLNGMHDKKYNLAEVYKACEIVDRYNINHLWGYYVPRYIAACNRTAYKYAMSLGNHYNKGYAEIDELLSKMPEELRYRYTPENVKALLGEDKK